MSKKAKTNLLDLPEELARKIVPFLGCKDVCNAMMACKALRRGWGHAHVALTTQTQSVNKMAGLWLFLQARAPVQVLTVPACPKAGLPSWCCIGITARPWCVGGESALLFTHSRKGSCLG